ncbi:MAG: low-specificity L-threonine aldolase [Dehalococcoidia bacterium]|nr:low-specificity L-threonine aldolase [Dehalococcoidia bacterium]
MRHVDLRSDTVTQPTPAMREAMYRAEIGDDGYGEDPTVNRLEEVAAERMGKEAAVFVASGTMGNLVAILTHCGRGDEVVMGDESHIFWYENGGPATLGGIHVRTVANAPDGTLPLDKLAAAIRPDNNKFPRTKLICLENTHNRCSGKVLSREYSAEVHALGREHGVPVHLDGARLFNAAVYLGIDASRLAGEAESVQFCFSKGLSAPVGSALCGSGAFIQEARRWRQALGGGMRQAGVIAAAALVGLETMVDRLAEDHENAQVLADGLAAIPGLDLRPEEIQTNIVICRPLAMPSDLFLRRLAEHGVKAANYWGGLVRFVTHYGIERADVDHALKAVQAVMRGPE